MKKKIIIICIIVIAIVGIVGIMVLNNKSNSILLNKTIYNYPYNDDLEEIKSIIDQMKTEERKKDKFSENYGIAVNLGEDKFYGCEYFMQEEVDKLNSIIKKYE